MTMRPRPLHLVALVLLLLGCRGAAHARGGGPDPNPNLPPLPPNVVAEVEDAPLTMDAFCRVAVQHVEQDLLESQSGPRAILDQLLEEALVGQWCKQYGLQITNREVDAKVAELRRQIRRRLGKSLEDMLRAQSTTMVEFRRELGHQLRREAVVNRRLGGTLPEDEQARVDQVKMIVGKLMQEAKREYGLPVVGHPTPVPMDPQHVARVNGQPITRQAFGEALVLRLPDSRVRDILDTECKIGIMTVQGVSLKEDALQDEIARMRRIWPLERTVLRRVVWMTVEFEDRFKAQFKQPVERVGNDRFYRGFFGLVRQMRPTVTEQEIRAAYEDEITDENGNVVEVRRKSQFDEHLLVTDISIGYQQRNDPFRRVVREKKEALREARKVLADASAGVPFPQIVNGVNARQDPSFTALDVRVYDSPDDRFFWDRVKTLQDGEVSSPIERIDSVHVMRRKGSQPARSFDELKELLREFVARRKAREYLTELVNDPTKVRVNWPLPKRGAPVPRAPGDSPRRR